MIQLADQSLSVPRPVVLKLLYACALAVYDNVKANYEDEKAIQTIKVVFNSKNASGIEDGLVKRIINFDSSKFVISKNKHNQIKHLLDEIDLKKTNFKSIHDYLIFFQQFIKDILNAKVEEKAESPKKEMRKKKKAVDLD